MEQLTEQEAIKINNYKEQLSTVLTNISSANNELGELLTKKAELENEYRSLKKTNDALSIENAVVSEKIHAIEELIDQSKTELKNKKHELDKLSLDNESELVLFNAKVNKRNEDIARLDKIVSKLESKIVSIEAEIERKKSELDNINFFIEKSDEIKKSKMDELTADIEEISAKKMKASIELTDSLSRLKEIEEKTKAEHDKYLEPIKHLAIEEEKLNRKREQIQILYNRARLVFERLYPGQNIDNLIK